MNVLTRVALATDREVEQALQVMLKGLSIIRPDIAPLLGDADNLRATLARDVPEAIAVAKQDDEAKVSRTLLVHLASEDQSAPRVIAALDARKKLIEPVTTALALAGIVMLLSTDIEVEHTEVDGKGSTMWKIKKKATSTEILKKFFDLFHA